MFPYKVKKFNSHSPHQNAPKQIQFQHKIAITSNVVDWNGCVNKTSTFFTFLLPLYGLHIMISDPMVQDWRERKRGRERERETSL